LFLSPILLNLIFNKIKSRIVNNLNSSLLISTTEFIISAETDHAVDESALLEALLSVLCKSHTEFLLAAGSTEVFFDAAVLVFEPLDRETCVALGFLAFLLVLLAVAHAALDLLVDQHAGDAQLHVSQLLHLLHLGALGLLLEAAHLAVEDGLDFLDLGFDLLFDFLELLFSLLLAAFTGHSARFTFQKGLDAFLLLFFFLNHFVKFFEVLFGFKFLLLLHESLLEEFVFSHVGGDALDLVHRVVHLLGFFLFLEFLLVFGFALQGAARQVLQVGSTDFHGLTAHSQLQLVSVFDVDVASVVRRAVVSEFHDFFDPGDGRVFARRFERTATEDESIGGVILTFDFEAVAVDGEGLDNDFTEHETAVQTVLLGVLLETEGVLVQDSSAGQDGGCGHAQFVDQVLSADAQVFVFDFALLLLLEAVGHVPAVQGDGQGDGGLFEFPVHVGQIQFLAVFACLAGLGVACALQLDGFLGALEAAHGVDAGVLAADLHASATDPVAHRPVSNVNGLLVLLAGEFVLYLLAHVEIGVVDGKVAVCVDFLVEHPVFLVLLGSEDPLEEFHHGVDFVVVD